jgi:signal transduction histidine kinase
VSSLLSTARYAAALEDHLRRSGQEQTLLHAYELGRELMGQGAGLLDIVPLHGEALARLEIAHDADSGLRRRADSFLAEVLAPFEMAYLGFKDANASLRRLTASLEEQVAERTRELQENLSVLQAAHAERRRLLSRLATAQEQERHRLANDLHDDTIQIMTAVALRISTLRGRLEATDQRIADRLEQTVLDSIGRLRRLVFELRPPALDHEGLAAAIRTFLTTALAEGPKHTLDDQTQEQPPLQVREIAYRITQEALTNVRKHARANHVHVTLTTYRGGIRVTVIDDGIGFDTRELDSSRPGHLGATAMRERAAMAGGWCTVDSTPGAGTTVVIAIPRSHEGAG